MLGRRFGDRKGKEGMSEQIDYGECNRCRKPATIKGVDPYRSEMDQDAAREEELWCDDCFDQRCMDR